MNSYTRIVLGLLLMGTAQSMISQERSLQTQIINNTAQDLMVEKSGMLIGEVKANNQAAFVLKSHASDKSEVLAFVGKEAGKITSENYGIKWDSILLVHRGDQLGVAKPGIVRFVPLDSKKQSELELQVVIDEPFVISDLNLKNHVQLEKIV